MTDQITRDSSVTIDPDGSVTWTIPQGATIKAAGDVYAAHLINSRVASVQAGCNEEGAKLPEDTSDAAAASSVLFSDCGELPVAPDERDMDSDIYMTRITVVSLADRGRIFDVEIRVLEDVDLVESEFCHSRLFKAGKLTEPTPRRPMGSIGTKVQRKQAQSASDPQTSDTDILARYETQEALRKRQGSKWLKLDYDGPLLQSILQSAEMSFLNESVDTGATANFHSKPLTLKGTITAEWTEGDNMDELRRPSLNYMTAEQKQALSEWGPSETVGKKFEMDVDVEITVSAKQLDTELPPSPSAPPSDCS